MRKTSLSLLLFISCISLSSHACQIISSDTQDEFYIDRTCSLKVYSPSKVKPYSAYFVQYIYTNDFNHYARVKGLTLEKLTVPIATQPYKNGFRVFAGPFNLSDAKKVRSRLVSIGYGDAMIKTYTPDAPPPQVVTKQSKPEPQIDQKNTTIMPNMTPVYNLSGNLAVLPTYDPDYEGKVTQYNNNYIGSYTYQQALSVCESVGRIATIKEYNIMLSNLDFVLDFGAKSQFWLSQTQTVTRVQNQVVPRKQKSSSHFNVICITQ